MSTHALTSAAITTVIDVSNTVQATQGVNFRAQIWFSSGQGATAVDEVMAVEIAGDLPNGATATRVIPGPVFLPSVNRPWSASTDSLTYRGVTGLTGATGGNNSSNFSVCNEGTVDCCAETIAKLDQVLSFVSRIYGPTGPVAGR